MKKIGIIFIVSQILLRSVPGNIIRVPQDRPSIQRAISSASDGDTILVAPGRYFENIRYDGKSIILGSYFLTTGDTSYISETIIDGDLRGHVVTFNRKENSNAALIGFTITYGFAWDNGGENSGGGILCGYKAAPRLEYLRIHDNVATFGGGGIFCFAESAPKIYQVEVNHNIAERGGGIYLEYNTTAFLKNVTVKNNYAGKAGGGLYVYARSTARIQNVVIFNNFSDDLGGGVHLYDCSPLFLNATIFGNIARRGGGVWCGFLSQAQFVNSIVWNNSPQSIFLSDFNGGFNSVTIAYSDVEGAKPASLPFLTGN